MTIKAINVRNQFKGTIKEIVQGDVLSEIDVQTAAGIVTSVITTRSVRELELQVGSEVIAFVKSTEVSIESALTLTRVGTARVGALFLQGAVLLVDLYRSRPAFEKGRGDL